MNQQTYATYVQERFNRDGDGILTDFMSRHNGSLYLGNQVNLNQLARRYGTPLEVVYYPQITAQIERMRVWADHARWKSRYSGDFFYAYATKANFSADVVQTALAAGAHYETSATADVTIAHHLWIQRILPADRLVCCNGSKEPAYLEAILDFRHDGCTNLVPILDDLDELAVLVQSSLPFQFGVRERAAGSRNNSRSGNDRFGLTTEEIDMVVQQLDGTPHQLTLYHAMVGTQIEQSEQFLGLLRESIEAYCRLRQHVPTLRYFNFGGGMPSSGYRLDFHFDYNDFLLRLMEQIRTTCEAYNVPMPDLIGEFGRYTVANHAVYLFEVGKVKPGYHHEPEWYLLNGSLMVSIPDMMLVENQEFMVLPLDNWDDPVQPVRLAGRRTCDSDDVYPRMSQEPLMLPNTGKGLTVAICGVGAYQQMISGRGGAHHCLSPEPQRIVVRQVAAQATDDLTGVAGEPLTLITHDPQQDHAAIMRLLGYQAEHMVLPVRTRTTVEHRLAS